MPKRPLTPGEKRQDDHEQDTAFFLVILLALLALGFVFMIGGLFWLR